jgi:hypothetical protein
MGTEVVKNSRFLVWDRITVGHLTTRYPRLLQNALFILDVYIEWYPVAKLAILEVFHYRCSL